MSLAYEYYTSTELVEKSGETADTLNKAFTGAPTSGSYLTWDGKTGESSAVYAGNSLGGNESIQLRSSNSNSGIVTTTSAGKIKSITITWNTNTTEGRVLNIYASNTAYTQATDLYNTSKDGDKVTTFTYAKGTETQTYEFTDEYEYIGIRSSSGALYLDEVVITWAGESEGGQMVETKVYKDSNFAIRFAAAEGLTTLDGIEAYGLMISAGDKDVEFTADQLTVAGGYCYMTVALGDIINNFDRLSTQFTVKAYVKVEGTKYLSEGEKTYSVVEMIKYYHDELGIEDVAPLYDYFQAKGKI